MTVQLREDELSKFFEPSREFRPKTLALRPGEDRLMIDIVPRDRAAWFFAYTTNCILPPPVGHGGFFRM